MKHYEFYRKYKIRHRPIVSPSFSKRNWWHTALITFVAVLIEPLIMYKHYKSVPFSLDYYLKIVEYCLMLVIPLGTFFYWANRQEWKRRNSGYIWIGKFEVISKRASFPFYYLMLTPGKNNKLKVHKNLFDKTRVGDFITIRRDSIGAIEDVSKINKFSNQLARARLK